MPSHFHPGLHAPSGNEQDIFTPASWSSLPLHTRQPDRGLEADIFSLHYEWILRFRSTPLAHDDTFHESSDSDPAAPSQDSEIGAGERNQMDWAERLTHISPIPTSTPRPGFSSAADIPTWQRGNRQWVEQHLWLLHQRSWDRSLLERSSSYIRALNGHQMEQQTDESDRRLETQRAEQRLEDLRVRAVQLNEEMNLFLEGWRARKDAEERLIQQRSDEEGLEEGDDVAGEEDAGQEEQLHRSRSEQLEQRQWVEETRAEMMASSISSRRVSNSSCISFLDLNC